MRQLRIPLTVSILSALTCLLVLTWILLSLISFKTAEKDLLRQKNDEGRLLLAAFVEVIPPSLTELPQSSIIATFAARLAKEKDFAGIYVIDGRGMPVFVVADRRGADSSLLATVRSGKESFAFSPDRRYLFRYAPVTSGDATIGAARLTVSLTGEQDRLRESRQLFLAYFVLDFLLLLGLGSFLLSRIVMVPIRKLLAATKRISSGDYHHRVHVPGSAEIAELAESFNAMAGVLEKKRVEVEETVRSLERANVELKSAREETIRSEKMASVGLLAAGMAHEIGTPLATIIGYAGILKDELQGDPVKADYLRRIESESSRIDRIVRGLLDYARPNRLHCVAVDTAKLVEETVELLNSQGVLKHITLSLQLSKSLPNICVDPHQLQQVLINLIINARDAMPADGVGQIEIRTGLVQRTAAPLHMQDTANPAKGRRKDDSRRLSHDTAVSITGWVTISVIDTGVGIPAENLQRVFDPFFTTKEPGKGTGLGLAISARILESFKGRIFAESEPGEGTVMTVWLPVMDHKEQT